MKAYRFLAITTVLAIFAGCQKAEIQDIQSKENEGKEIVEEGQPIAVTGQSRLMSASLENTKSINEALQEAASAAEQTGNSLSLPDTVKSFQGFGGWQLQVYKIVYKTVDIKGDTIQLAGHVGLLNSPSGKTRMPVDAVSLFHTAVNTEELTTTLYEVMVLPFRALYNHVVVYPFYQGIDIDKGVHPVTISEPLLKARQAIDCEVAAMELLDILGIDMDRDYYTANMGISNGGATTVATQYMLENYPEYREINRDIIRLKGTYVGEGCYSFRELIPSLTAPAEKSLAALLVKDYLSIIKSASYIACLVGSYDTWKGINGHYEDVPDIDVYFSEEFLNIQRPYWNDGLSIINYIDQNIPRPEPDGYTDYIDMFRKGLLCIAEDKIFNLEITVADMINPELLGEDGLVDMSNPYLITVQKAFSENDIFLGGWAPHTMLKMAHSVDDDFVDFKQVREVFEGLNNNGFNRNVALSTVKGLDHLTGTFFFLIKDILAKEEPWQ